MSMMARFIAVAPERLAEMRKSPERVEALFVADVPLGRFEFTSALPGTRPQPGAAGAESHSGADAAGFACSADAQLQHQRE